ncbi:Pescadillo-like protein, partial [Fragariocoptes setiger]
MVKKLSKRQVRQRRKAGMAKAYMSRAAAVRKLQLSLKDFRRLCIMKGIYPVEPKHKSSTGTSSRHKTYYFTRDIQYLMHEPIIWKFWNVKHFMKRLSRAKGRHDLEQFNRVRDNRPDYQLDEIVKERYPKFVDALRDCDDALSMCFLYAMFAKGRDRPDDLVDLSRRLTIEFLYYVIHSRSLRKAFISIKGYYYQAEIMGQTITWLIPHQFVIDRVSNVDLNVMRTFTEFYITLMGFINFKLYKTINALYPPQVSSVSSKGVLSIKKDCDSLDDLLASLNGELRLLVNRASAQAEGQVPELDHFDEDEQEATATNEPAKKIPRTELTFHQTLSLENLFKDKVFFLNREVPREALTFVIRSFGGQVSWDKTLFPGSTFDESDPSITYHIIDRENVRTRRLDRIYVQPQWVFDSINMRMCLPVDEYLPGAKLPPHLSPFVEERKGDYVPPDKIRLLNLRKAYESELNDEAKIQDGDISEDGATTDGEGAEDATRSEIENCRIKEKRRRRKERDSNKSNKKSGMRVKPGKLQVVDRAKLEEEEAAEHRKMEIMMIPKRKKRLFDRITKTQKEKKHKVDKMKAKRKVVDNYRRKYEHKIRSR